MGDIAWKLRECFHYDDQDIARMPKNKTDFDSVIYNNKEGTSL